MSYLDRKDLLSADLMTRIISKEGSIKYYNSDKNVANIYMKLMAKSQDGAQKEVSVDEASNYTVTIDAIKSKTNQIRTVPGVLSNDLTDETCAIWKFELGEDLTNQIGEVICQTYVKNTTQNLTMRYFAYTVEADKLTGLNSEIVTDPDLPILKELIKEVQETAQTVNNIDNVNVSDTKTYSNKKIEEKFSGVDAQFNTVAKKDDIFTMANMGQDVKEALTGGSVAVVGKNVILEDNVVYGQITPPTTNFLKTKGNLIDNSYFKITQTKYLNGITGEIAVANGDNYWVVENYIPVEVGKTYVFNSGISWLYCYDSAKNFVSRVATTDCSVTWKRATVPEGVSYVRIYCDKSVFNYTKIYLFEYDNTLTYGRNEPIEDNLPKTNYFINNFSLSKSQVSSITSEVKTDVINSIIYKRISDYSKLIFNGCKVKLIGDSITAGQGGTNFNTNFNTSGGELITNKIWAKSWYTNDAGHCWANSLRDYLTQKFGCTVKNFGCPGIGVDQMILAIDDLVREDDELVICMIGTNNRHNMQLTEFYTKLKQIYEIITITKGKKCIMMSCMPASVENELSSNRIFHMEDIDNMYFKLSCEKNIEYISIYKEVIKYCNIKGINIDTLLTSDGLHPNDSGYIDVMFMIICMALGFAPKRDGASW